MGRLGVSLEGSGVAVYSKGLKTQNCCFSYGISMILWSGAAILWAGPAVPWAGTASMWAGTAALEAARTDSRCSQTLPGTPRSSQELPEAVRSQKKRFLAGFRGRCGGGSRRPEVAWWPMTPPNNTFSKETILTNQDRGQGWGWRTRTSHACAPRRGGGYK